MSPSKKASAGAKKTRNAPTRNAPAPTRTTPTRNTPKTQGATKRAKGPPKQATMWEGQKISCMTCIKGHRATACEHLYVRPMFFTRSPGRPLTTCPHAPCWCGHELNAKECCGHVEHCERASEWKLAVAANPELARQLNTDDDVQPEQPAQPSPRSSLLPSDGQVSAMVGGTNVAAGPSGQTGLPMLFPVVNNTNAEPRVLADAQAISQGIWDETGLRINGGLVAGQQPLPQPAQFQWGDSHFQVGGGFNMERQMPPQPAPFQWGDIGFQADGGFNMGPQFQPGLTQWGLDGALNAEQPAEQPPAISVEQDLMDALLDPALFDPAADLVNGSDMLGLYNTSIPLLPGNGQFSGGMFGGEWDQPPLFGGAQEDSMPFAIW
ncbi:hypothetical protein BKA67DRAFT_662373 [Truncatella angustata]|uniref:Copper-fist domain-containing protein n=1 Tax=Truncatella angustata TaxID=152316 RepID=A0A9P8RP52_9PEZI|nr:uncharacterized protein BKA67DRAFT_662373 [Truncatella angustata]KAH6647598.1 hypothetical protein BKA67DRAFT_662373 [Truncatella angustata]